MNKSDLKKVTSYRWVKILCASLIIAASIVMIVLTILRMTKTTEGSPTAAFQIIIGVALILIGLTSAIITLANGSDKFDIKAVIADGILVGAGIFVMLEVASDVLNSFIGYFVPSVISGIGLFMLVKSIVDLIKKNNTTKSNIVLLILSIVVLVGGILLLIYADKVLNYMWLIVGLVILAYSTTLLVRFIKDKKA